MWHAASVTDYITPPHPLHPPSFKQNTELNFFSYLILFLCYHYLSRASLNQTTNSSVRMFCHLSSVFFHTDSMILWFFFYATRLFYEMKEIFTHLRASLFYSPSVIRSVLCNAVYLNFFCFWCSGRLARIRFSSIPIYSLSSLPYLPFHLTFVPPLTLEPHCSFCNAAGPAVIFSGIHVAKLHCEVFSVGSVGVVCCFLDAAKDFTIGATVAVIFQSCTAFWEEEQRIMNEFFFFLALLPTAFGKSLAKHRSIGTIVLLLTGCTKQQKIWSI